MGIPRIVLPRERPECTEGPLEPHTRRHLQGVLGTSRYALAPGAMEGYLAGLDRQVRCGYPGVVEVLVASGGRVDPLAPSYVAILARRAAAVIATPAMARSHPVLPIRIFIVPCPDVRTVPPPGEPVEPRHINGGFTYTTGDDIYLFRREELGKVMVHELLHHSIYHVDPWPPAVLRRMYVAFGIDSDGCDPAMDRCPTMLRPNEAVVEAYALLYHLALVSGGDPRMFAAMWKQELAHAFDLAAWVRDHQATLAGGKWKEGTHAFSYLCLRAALLREGLPALEGHYDPEQMAAIMDRGWQKLSGTTTDGARRPTALRMTVFGSM